VPIEVAWSPLALARLQQIRDYVGQDKPEAAGRLAMRIVAVVEALRDHPHLGRAGSDTGIRELVIGGTPYIVIYSVEGERVIVSTIWHGAQRG
jgi:toxin ParE1/3/4